MKQITFMFIDLHLIYRKVLTCFQNSVKYHLSTKEEIRMKIKKLLSLSVLALLLVLTSCTGGGNETPSGKK